MLIVNNASKRITHELMKSMICAVKDREVRYSVLNPASQKEMIETVKMILWRIKKKLLGFSIQFINCA